jgi:ATP-dependent RNA helicase DDX31/DBP7
MAEDGLLLNFSVADSGPPRSTLVQPKGRWKDRALAKKRGRINQSRTSNGISSAQPTSDGVSSNQAPIAAKEQEPASEPASSQSRPLKRKRGATSIANSSQPARRTNPSSSLFTHNSEILTHTEQGAQNTEYNSADPTNAPLLDSSDFQELGISAAICSGLERSMSISKPTQIQKIAIPHLLNSSQDTFLRAQTGSGKTLAFVLPILQTLLSLPTNEKKYDRTSGLFAIIITPTRELAQQTEAVLTSITTGTWIVPGWLLGGERKKSEKARLRKGVNILVATPGRLADHLETTMALDTGLVRYMVFDEGDRLVDMGFLETVGKILRIVEGRVQHHLLKAKASGVLETRLPSRLTKIFCSATLKGEEGFGALESVVEPVFLKAEQTENTDPESPDDIVTPGQLLQKGVIVPEKLRFVTLCSLLTTFGKAAPPSKAIIFFSSSISVDHHSQLLSSFELNMNIFQIHGSMEQVTRTTNIRNFNASKGRALLLATDVASRGLDMPYVNMILQYDPPLAYDDYVNRIGRTARAGRAGQGIIFLLPGEEGYLDVLKSHGAKIERITYDVLIKEAFGKEWMNKATTYQLKAEQWVLGNEEVLSCYIFDSLRIRISRGLHIKLTFVRIQHISQLSARYSI